VLVALIKTEPIRAAMNPETSKPGTIMATIKSINALITNLNKPKVNMFIGNAIIKRIGFIVMFTIPKINAASKAVQKLLTLTKSGNRYAAKKIDKPTISK
jgi:hypothetical protein